MTHTLIKPHHLERLAYVYLRQSSPGQVRNNREGRQRQQAMVEHVAGLGWPQSRIILLDQDSGRSGSSQHGREALQRLLEAIVTGKAGLVAARELSRLVRDNQDWSRLVRLCRFEDVLLADEHRLYNPADPQDRMVLGIQGAFNEFELSMIVDRMHQCLRQKAERGEHFDALPPGYICRHPPLCEKHPDPRVQRAVEKVLHDFGRFSSARQLYLHLIDEMFQLPVVMHGRDWREVEWITPSYMQILELVRNPAYAGMYVRGRTKAITALDSDGNKQTKRRRVPRDAWDVFLEDHHDAYITPEAWERNVEKIDANANVRGPLAKGAVGRGCSLMAGLLRCRRCGHRLQAQYSSGGVRYVCSRGDRQRLRGPARCLAFSGTALESLLVEEILEVIAPTGVEAAQRATERLAMLHQEQRQLLLDRVQAAVEAEQRAAREYKQTDATYMAVRQTLGAEWEASLARVAAEQLRLSKFDQRQPTLPTAAQREQLARLGEDVRRLAIMARRLFGFMSMMAILAIAFGTWLWLGYHDTGRWLMVKLVFVVALLAYHGACRALLMRVQRGTPMPPPWVLRVLNESALLIVVPIILLAVAGFASQAMVRVTDSLLPQIAADFGTTVGEASIVVAAYAVSHGTIQLIIGPVGDRFGKYRTVTLMCALASILVALCGTVPPNPRGKFG